VKTRRSIPETDLANIAPIEDRAQKRAALERLKLGHPPYSYAPMRLSILDILNIDPGPLAAGVRAPWEAVAAEVTRRCKRSDEEVAANLRVAEGLFRYAEALALTGRRHEFFAMPLGVAAKVNFWSPIVVAIDGRATVPFFDPRRTKKLTERGRRFAVSVMHERIRAADPDFAEVGLAIYQFENTDEGMRPPKPHFDDGISLFGFHDLAEMTSETYAMWHEVLDEREEEVRRRAAGMKGDLL